MLTRLVGALLVLLVALAPSSLHAQAIAPVGVTTKTANAAHEVGPVLGREAFVMSDEANSRAWFIIMGAVVGGVVGGIEFQRSAKHCDDCFFSGQVGAAVIGLSAAAGALAGFLIHEAFFTSSSPVSNELSKGSKRDIGMTSLTFISTNNSREGTNKRRRLRQIALHTTVRMA